MIPSFRTDMPGQTVQTQIRLLPEEQSDQGLHCLPFRLHRLDSLLYGRATVQILVITTNVLGVRILGNLRYFSKLSRLFTFLLEFQFGLPCHNAVGVFSASQKLSSVMVHYRGNRNTTESMTCPFPRYLNTRGNRFGFTAIDVAAGRAIRGQHPPPPPIILIWLVDPQCPANTKVCPHPPQYWNPSYVSDSLRFQIRLLKQTKCNILC